MENDEIAVNFIFILFHLSFILDYDNCGFINNYRFYKIKIVLKLNKFLLTSVYDRLQ